nr:type I-E CRISPR-associated protein Cas6/Cse3/CasE [Schaalia sp. ZJ1691]
MYLTRIQLDPSRRLAQKYLGSPQVMHAVVMKAAGDTSHEGPGRVLWRVDHGYSQTTLYFLTPNEPDCEQILQEAGDIGIPSRTVDYMPFLNKLREGDTWAFRLCANPTRAVSHDGSSRGKIHTHVTVSHQADWLLSKAPDIGIRIVPSLGNEDEPSIRVTQRNRRRFGRKDPFTNDRGTVTIGSVVYEGALEVTDVSKIRLALINGIGRSKAYGCGLMTLAQMQRS